MKLSIVVCLFALLMGCDGEKTATSSASGAESSANEPTQRLAAAGEPCGRTADCDEGLRCLEQKCTSPKGTEPSGDVKAQYMAQVEKMCECMKDPATTQECMKPAKEALKKIEKDNADVPKKEQEEIEAAAKSRLQACSKAALAKSAEDKPEAEEKIEEETPEEELKAANAKKADKEKGFTIDPKKVGLDDLVGTNQPRGEGAIANILKPNDGSTKLAAELAGSGTDFDLNKPIYGGRVGGPGRIGGTGSIELRGGSLSKGMKRRRRVWVPSRPDPQMTMSRARVSGFCSKSDIRRQVRRRATAIRECYEKALMRNPKLAGKVTARWNIGTDGRVKGRISASGLGAVGNCVASRLRPIRWIRFKPPEGGRCVVQQDFVFSWNR